MSFTYKRDLEGVSWSKMKAALLLDDFDNGRTRDQLRKSFENSDVTCLAYDGDRLIGTARGLSDGICNAYIVDVWTLTPYRSQRVASNMMEMLLDDLQGQHVYLFTDDAIDFYKKIGFSERLVGLEKVVGNWLEN